MKTLKTLLLIIVLVLCADHLYSQKKFRKLLLIGSGQFISGFIDGTVESINYHYYNGFKLRCPKANDKFWNPEQSWKNKYMNGDPTKGEKFMGSTTCFAFTTDAYHMLRTSKRTIDGVSICYLMNDDVCNKRLSKKKRFKAAVKDFAVLTAIRCVGFHLSYSYLFKRQVQK
jgi:hypothetical protein